MIESVAVKVGEGNYPILIGENFVNFDEYSDIFRSYINEPVAIITNELIEPLYLERWQKRLNCLGFSNCHYIVLKDGEVNKTIETLNQIYTELLENRFSRYSLLIALGGGVIGDMVGFAAATFLRGISFIQVPTTLLAQVDSSVGGKTAINHPLGKNMVGAFYQPKAVFSEIDTLDTLPNREYNAGIAEIIKYGCIYDQDFFNWLIEHTDALLNRDKQILIQAIKKSCQIKAYIVEKDEKEESNLRALLNFGHTFGHAIEQVLGFGNWLHGEAVSCGMVLAMRLSNLLGNSIDQRDQARLIEFLEKFNLPIHLPENIDKTQLINVMLRDKKNKENQIRFVILKRLGHAVVANQVDIDLINQVFA